MTEARNRTFRTAQHPFEPYPAGSHAPPRPWEKWLPWPQKFSRLPRPAPPHPEKAPSLTVTPPRGFSLCRALPHAWKFFPLPRPEAKQAQKLVQVDALETLRNTL